MTLPPGHLRIVFVLTYPVYHSLPDLQSWLRWENGDRWMPGIAAAYGCEVELWGVGREDLDARSSLSGFGDYRIRLFRATGGGRKSRNHDGAGMVEAARRQPADLYLLVGADGGAGLRLVRDVLVPRRQRFAVILGGSIYSRVMPHADWVLYESDRQRRALERAGWRFWRRSIAEERLIRLPRSVDTDLFCPRPSGKDWDVISVSRLVSCKSFDEVGRLSRTLKVAVVGDGSMRHGLQRRFPAVEWLGHIPNPQVPALLNRARLFVHAGRREYFPRALVEAMACGLPTVAFDDYIEEDVLPRACGILVNQRNYVREVHDLLANPGGMTAYGRAGRALAVRDYGRQSTTATIGVLLAEIRRESPRVAAATSFGISRAGDGFQDPPHSGRVDQAAPI